MSRELKEFVYYVKGMYCASCEVLIEKKLLEFSNVKSVDASVSKGSVRVVFEGDKPDIRKINKLFEKEGYFFGENPIDGEKKGNFLLISGTIFVIIVLFLFLKNTKLASLVNVSASSSLPTFFLLGLIAGVSSCAALVGGLVLSMSKQWLSVYSEKNSFFEKTQPHILFNLGRILSYGFFGGIIGLVGREFQLSFGFAAVLVLLVSVLMVALSLQMLGVKAFRGFQITLPRFILRKITNENKFQGRYMPTLLGAFTFFLPCGFTLTAQGLALISGSFLQGALIMMFFALGTTPGLLAIGLSSVKFLEKPHLSDKFLKVAGVLVMFFALYNINAQLNVLNLPSLSDISLGFAKEQNVSRGFSSFEKDLPPIVGGKQLIKMEASSYGYKPNYFKVRAGMPVRWEIKDTGSSGCTNVVIAPALFSGTIPLSLGKVSVKEFIPKKEGRYKFSCWMGMISGIIEVVK